MTLTTTLTARERATQFVKNELERNDTFSPFINEWIDDITELLLEHEEDVIRRTRTRFTEEQLKEQRGYNNDR